MAVCYTASAPAAEDPEVYRCREINLPDTCTRIDVLRFRRRADDGVDAPNEVMLPEISLSPANACVAELWTAYSQENRRIKVETEIVNDDCVMSSGQYTVEAETIDSDGNAHTREFLESWRRTKPGPIETVRYYDMKGDVGLMWLKISTSSPSGCLCDDETTDTEPKDAVPR